ncbi:hypothetical protein PSN45_004617 [Yamadazyma tenuis]|uniref:Ribosomal protein L17 n=1 Tax=Candida tenuis (strain ATCC 10573 / BCRC 21748 / CBS 615 / JCM 9827 / NBRC 10315 / NRRL Y-1498 / VKM Y-70) TaxID=590646 RepID=G3B765_CANTC|nr:ribosomal protein L17 [Yamadazyma tenuis ATCC 10573]EGV63113.1 ribosomal protein L17 [Yamadazyma tenuis ATCC 10573]WEJ97070.1 hypothetical protein PSN45_004617 [Yamadazyma tenuis]
MPSLQKYQVNVARHVKSMDKNITANLIRHESIVTTRAKAKRAQSKVERFLSRTLNENQSMLEQPLQYKLKNNKNLRYLQPPDMTDVGPKVLNELAQRYPNRSHGFTRIIKLEPRLGEDKAPMSVLELVDSNLEVKFWYYAKIAARLQLQGLELDSLTANEIRKLTTFRNDGEVVFAKAVETAKVEFFKYNPETEQVEDAEIQENLKNVPRPFSRDRTVSKKFQTKPRPAASASVELPKSPFATA